MKIFIYSCLCMLTVILTVAETPFPAPVAKIIPQVDVIHGDQRVDNYSWLRGKTNSEVVAYLKAENSYADQVMKPTRSLQNKLYKEMVSRIKETDESVPYRKGDWFYYRRNQKGKQYPIFCRKFQNLEAKEQVILDLNKLARGLKFLSVGTLSLSDDGHLLAYSLDTTGFRQYTLYVKDLRTGKLKAESIEKTGSVAWAADNKTFFYTVEDSAKRQYRLYRHRLGDRSSDILIFEEKDEMFDVGVSRSRSHDYLFMGSTSKTSAEFRYIKADAPNSDWKVLLPREKDHEYDIDHHGDKFYIRSNKAGRNFQLVSIPEVNPTGASWTVVIPHRPAVMLSGVDFFESFYVAVEREHGLPKLRVVEFATDRSRAIEFPESAYDVAPAENSEWKTTAYRYSYESLVSPRSTYDYQLTTGQSTLLKRQEVPGGYVPTDYVSERLEAKAADGTSVPISIVYKKGLKQNGASPLLLQGYGSYGISEDVNFSTSRLSLLDRGLVIAIAHIRGGGELGKPWHDSGRMMNKKTTFTDFITVAEHLIAKKYTQRDRLAIMGGSAGGLLMGAVTNLRPDLFKGVVAVVPFMDVINTMLDETLPLTVSEFEEWGNPKKKEEYDYMKTYCPYTNITAQDYPAILVKTSFNDSQVMYWEPAKYTAKLRATKTDRNELLFKINMDAGHGGASGRYDHLKESAFVYAWILKTIATN
ncbi:MAG: S9 family peptidase [Pedosphaera sp.]|nr:S9 family peptidase [Pedosphaera sp.]